MNIAKKFGWCWLVVFSISFDIAHAASYELHRYGFIEDDAASQIDWLDSAIFDGDPDTEIPPPPRSPSPAETMGVVVDKSGAMVFMKELTTGHGAAYVDPSEEVINLTNKTTVFTVAVDNGFADSQGLPTLPGGGPTKYGLMVQGGDGVLHYGEYMFNGTGASDAISSQILNGLKESFCPMSTCPAGMAIDFYSTSMQCDGSNQCLKFTISSPPKNTVVVYVKQTCNIEPLGYDGPCDFENIPAPSGTHKANGKLMIAFAPAVFSTPADYAFTLHWGQNQTTRISAADARCSGVASIPGAIGCFSNLISTVTSGQVVTKCLNHWQQEAPTCTSPNVEKLLIDTAAGKGTGILYPTSDLSDSVQSNMFISNTNVGNENLIMESGPGPVVTRSIAFDMVGQKFPFYEFITTDDRGVVWTGESIPSPGNFEQPIQLPFYNNGVMIYSSSYNAATASGNRLILAIDHNSMPTAQISTYDVPPGISLIGVVVPVVDSSGRERIWFSAAMNYKGVIGVFNKDIIDAAVGGGYTAHECAPDESADTNACFQFYDIPIAYNYVVSYGLRWVNGPVPNQHDQDAIWLPSGGILVRVKPLDVNGNLTNPGVVDIYSLPLTSSLDSGAQGFRGWITNIVWLPKSGELVAGDYSYSNVLLLDPAQAATTDCVLLNDDGTAPCVKRLDVSTKKPAFGPYGTSYDSSKVKNLAYDSVRNLLWMAPGLSETNTGAPLGYIKLAGSGEKNFDSSNVNSAWNNNLSAWDYLPLPLGSENSLGGWFVGGGSKYIDNASKNDYRYMGVMETLDVAANGDIVVGSFTNAYNRIVLDFDSDGIADDWEATYNLSPLNPADAVNIAPNGLSYLYDYQNGLNPTLSDNDVDGMPDTWEIQYGLNPLVNDGGDDLDGDGISNLQEYLNGSDPTKKPVKNDFNSDQTSDVLLRNITNGDWNLAQLNGLSILNQGSVNGASDTNFTNTGIATVATADFNGDGKADILTRSTAVIDGHPVNTFHIDIISGANVVSSSWLTTMSTSSDDVVMSTKDFNKDGKADVLLRNNVTGVWTINYMNGTNEPTIVTLNASTDTCYTMKGDGDYDGNGYPDILLRKDVGGACGTASYPWLIDFTNGTSSIMTSSTAPGVVVSTGWSPVVTDKDFNHDGKSDILVRINSGSTQQWVMYDMNGTTAVSGITVSGVAVQSIWQFEAVGDFNGDQKPDLMLRSTSSGQLYIYLMDNATVLSSGAGAPGTYNVVAPWTFQGVDDYNGDGKNDILLRNTSTGGWYLYLMNGYTPQSSGSLSITTDTNYVLQSH